MGTISGVLTILVTVAFFFYYKPKAESSLWICVICVAMGLLTPIAPANTWFLQMISVGTKGVALVCCYAQLSREDRERRADAAKARRMAERKKRRRFLDAEEQIRPAA